MSRSNQGIRAASALDMQATNLPNPVSLLTGIRINIYWEMYREGKTNEDVVKEKTYSKQFAYIHRILKLVVY